MRHVSSWSKSCVLRLSFRCMAQPRSAVYPTPVRYGRHAPSAHPPAVPLFTCCPSAGADELLIIRCLYTNIITVPRRACSSSHRLPARWIARLDAAPARWGGRGPRTSRKARQTSTITAWTPVKSDQMLADGTLLF